MDAILKDVCKALLEADVNVKLVQQLRSGIKASLNLEGQPVGINKRRLVHKVCMSPFLIPCVLRLLLMGSASFSILALHPLSPSVINGM